MLAKLSFKVSHRNTIGLLFMILFTSCGDNSNNDKSVEKQDTITKSETRPPVKEIPKSGSVEGDTINISGRYVLFFHPSPQKAKSLNLGEQEINRFKSTANSIIDSIGSISQGVSASLTTLDHVRIYGRKGYPMIISLTSFSDPFGMIISDGTQISPITKGNRSREAYLEQISRVLNYETRKAP